MTTPLVSRPMTVKQQSALNFLVSHIAKNGFPPTRAEITRHFGWASENAAQECLVSIARKGKIKMTAGVSRGIKVIA